MQQAHEMRKTIKNTFDEVVDMTGTGSVKWELAPQIFGVDGITPMWIADMDFRGPEAVVEALKRRAEIGVYGYTGKPDYLYEAVGGWLERRHGWRVEKDWICYSPGVAAALNACVLTLTEPGDRVVIQPPVYPPFFQTVKENGRELVLNPLRLMDGKYRMDLDDLRVKIRESGAKMLILCSPHNPVGRVWSKDELERLAQICDEHGIIVVSDEIHADLVLRPHKHISLVQAAPRLENRAIVCMAPTKTFNMGGLAISFTIIPNPQLRESFLEYLKKAHLTAVNPFSLTAADAAYRHGDEWLDRVLDYIKANFEHLADFIHRRLPELKVNVPEGTYLAWIDCRGLGLEPDDLQRFMLKEARVALNVGSTFGDEGAGFMRMNMAAPRSVLDEALARIEAAVAARRKGRTGP